MERCDRHDIDSDWDLTSAPSVLLTPSAGTRWPPRRLPNGCATSCAFQGRPWPLGFLTFEARRFGLSRPVEQVPGCGTHRHLSGFNPRWTPMSANSFLVNWFVVQSSSFLHSPASLATCVFPISFLCMPSYMPQLVSNTQFYRGISPYTASPPTH